jgi:hypothetical protein
MPPNVQDNLSKLVNTSVFGKKFLTCGYSICKPTNLLAQIKKKFINLLHLI